MQHQTGCCHLSRVHGWLWTAFRYYWLTDLPDSVSFALKYRTGQHCRKNYTDRYLFFFLLLSFSFKLKLWPLRRFHLRCRRYQTELMIIRSQHGITDWRHESRSGAVWKSGEVSVLVMVCVDVKPAALPDWTWRQNLNRGIAVGPKQTARAFGRATGVSPALTEYYCLCSSPIDIE